MNGVGVGYLVDTDWLFDAAGTFDENVEVAVTRVVRVHNELGRVTDANSILLNSATRHVTFLGVDRYKPSALTF